ncbi:hypothetical protein [Brevibacillus borstelensis]|uniref:hypothetical protein n=1 Tax=Brevibacillus borstelensis TaxID=45462 RepID=UPI0030C46602
MMESMLRRHEGMIASYANSPAILKCVYDLFHCTKWGAMKRLYAESKAMKLIALISQKT